MHSEEIGQTEVLTTDIIIIGGGGAGLAAALAAAEKGCTNIIVLEKAGSTGGNSAMAHDLFGVESPVQTRMGTDASRDHFFQVAMRWCHWSKVNPRLVRAFIDKSGDTIRWLQEKGIKFELGQYYINQSPRIRHCIEGEGAELMKTLGRLCREKGVEILTHARAYKLLRGERGNVSGILAKRKERKIVVHGKCVIVTTGGYAANKELLQKYCSYYNPETVTCDGVSGNVGDGISMASDIGVALAGLGHIMFRGPIAYSSKPVLLMLEDGKFRIGLGTILWEPETIWVNKRGRRFIDEGHNLASFASANTVAQQPDCIMYSLFDDTTRQRMEEQGLIRPGAYGGQISHRFKRPVAGMPIPGLGEELQKKAVNDETIKVSGSLKEIADWIGVRPEILKTTVEEYNNACAQGHDPVFCKDRRYLLPIRKAPYYAIKGHASVCDAIGGIKINERMEALDGEDEPIPGLYAGGSATGCWESENYCYEMTGHLLGFALNSGRMAGENAAEYVAESVQEV
jgi:fumarate reductase flavoprotein subunit